MEVEMFPWLAFGHMIPFLELSKRLAARGHAVAFVSTPRNLARLPPVPPHLSARLRFISLPPHGATHCGWGSIVESFAFGHPLVMLPFVIDQPLVARAMEEKGIGVEVARNDTDGSIDKDGVAVAVLRVMVDDEGKVFARNARRLQEVLADEGAQERYIDDLVKQLRASPAVAEP